MKIRGRERTLGEVVCKSITFIPKRIYWRYHDAWMRREFARVLAGGADVREENMLRKYLVRTLRRAHSNVPYWSDIGYSFRRYMYSQLKYFILFCAQQLCLMGL